MNKSVIEKILNHYKVFLGCIVFFMLIGIAYLYRTYPLIEFNLSSTNFGEPICIFYTKGNMSDFDAEHVFLDIIEMNNQVYCFSVPGSRALRIDFGTGVGRFQISNVTIKTLFTIKEISAEQLSTLFFSVDVGQVGVENNVLLIESIGGDPYIVLGDLNEFDSRLNLHTIGSCFLALIIAIIISGVISIYYHIIILFLTRNSYNIVLAIKKIWNTVRGRCMIILLSFGFLYLYNGYPKIEFEMISNNPNEAIQVYYDNGNREFDSNHMVWDLIEAGKQKYSFSVPNSDILRIGFGRSAGMAQISNVKIENIFTTRELSAQFIASGDFSVDVGGVLVKNDELIVECTGISPYVILRNLRNINCQINFYKIFILILGFGVIVCISCFVEKYNETIEKILNIRKKSAVVISFLFFLGYRVTFLIRHVGFFAIDEFFHMATLNPNYISDYNRAPYINYALKVICWILGKSDFTVKLIPFTMGLISFLCGLYLLYWIYDNPYWIITISGILTCMPCIVFNHFYIRMYVFLEAVIMLNCVLLYNAWKKRGTKWEKASILIAGILIVLYCYNTQDMSANALLGLTLMAISYYFYKKYVEKIIKKMSFLKQWIILLLVCSSLITLGALKYNRILTIINWIIKIGFDERYYADNPVFFEFIFKKLFYISMPFIISLIYIWKRKKEDKKILFIIAVLPLLGYIIVFHNLYYFRAYNAFLPIVCILSYLILDKLRFSGLQHLALIIAVLILTINMEGGFWKLPRMINEVNFSNISGAVSDAKNLREQGYEIVPFMTSQIQLAYYDLLDVNTNLQLEDIKEEIWESNNETQYDSIQYLDSDLIKAAKEVIIAEFDEIFNSDTKKVLITDEAGTDIFWTEFDESWLEKCEIKRYAGNVNMIIVN